MKKIIGIITATRAEYGLLKPLIEELSKDTTFETNLIVTGTHLSEFHGKTIDLIINDGLSISKIIDMKIVSDTENSICNSISTGLKSFSQLINNKKFDLIIVLGDRYELLSFCIASLIHKIPIAHIHGGEVTLGLIDEAIRHSITKMSSIHFPSIELYAKRIIQMGEEPSRVFVTGALGLDNIKKIKMIQKDELSIYTGIDFNKDVALVTFHPVTLDKYEDAQYQIEEVLNALLETKLVSLITMPNSDTGGNTIFKIIKKYSDLYPQRFQLRKNLGQVAYLSAMKYSKIMVGNTSSGIIESASFRIPVVNIGDRQGGRYKPDNIIDCICSKKEILSSIEKALSKDFLSSLRHIENPYGDGKAAKRILNILKQLDLTDKQKLIKKPFFDMN